MRSAVLDSYAILAFLFGEPGGERAGEIKAQHAMPLADCFAAALAKQHRAELYTGDPEFHAVEKDVRIVWLPQATPPA